MDDIIRIMICGRLHRMRKNNMVASQNVRSNQIIPLIIFSSKPFMFWVPNFEKCPYMISTPRCSSAGPMPGNNLWLEGGPLSPKYAAGFGAAPMAPAAQRCSDAMTKNGWVHVCISVIVIIYWSCWNTWRAQELWCVAHDETNQKRSCIFHGIPCFCILDTQPVFGDDSLPINTHAGSLHRTDFWLLSLTVMIPMIERFLIPTN